MKFEIILFNITILIFIIFLIYLYMYINCTYENFADSDSQATVIIANEDTIVDSTVKADYLKNTATFDKSDYQVAVTNKLDGNTDSNAYPSAIIPQLVRTFKRYKGGSTSIQHVDFPDGYYWIKFNDKATQYIYCIMNEAYYGGGWMLAMRGVKNSKTFNYDSTYWTDERVLNSDYETIKKTLQTALGIQSLTQSSIKTNKELQNISSIGNAIYSSDLNPDVFDIKTDAFNSYNAREWMAIFYYKNSNGSISRGGDYISKNEGGKTEDDIEISTENKNTRGWIWRELARSSRVDGEPEPMRELFFNRRTRTGGLDNTNNNLDFLAKYGLSHAAGLNKWRRKNTDTGTSLWSGQYGFNFYGINWEHPSTGNGFKVRWGFVWNNEGHEIVTCDSACGIGMRDFSCRDDNRWGGTEVQGCSDTIAYEIYVR